MLDLITEAGALTTLLVGGLVGLKIQFEARARARLHPIRLALTPSALARRHEDLARAQEALRHHASL